MALEGGGRKVHGRALGAVGGAGKRVRKGADQNPAAQSIRERS